MQLAKKINATIGEKRKNMIILKLSLPLLSLKQIQET